MTRKRADTCWLTRTFREWACLDLNQGPLPYQGSALTELSYRPVRHGLGAKEYAGKGYRIWRCAGSVALLQRDLYAAREVSGDVVEHRADRGQCRDEHDIDRTKQARVAEHARGGQVGVQVEARRTLA